MNDRDYLGVMLTLFLPEGELRHLWLPVKPEGSYRFEGPEGDRDRRCAFLSINGADDRWMAVCHEDAYIQWSGNDRRSEAQLADGQVLLLGYRGQKYILRVEYQSRGTAVFTNYSFCTDTQISIGRDRKCGICCDNGLITEVHAYLRRAEGSWYVMDNNSTNGTFVNGRRIDRTRLNPGDEIYIMGLRIIIGLDFIAVNDKNGRTTVQAGSEKRLDCESLRPSSGGGDTEPVYFNRQPRIHTARNAGQVKLECPPPSIGDSQVPMLLSMGSSMFRGGMSLMSGNFSMMVSSVLFPVLTRQYTDKQRKEYETLRLTKYTEYLYNKQREITARCTQEEQWRNEQYPELSEVLKYTDSGEHMWERRPMDEDFLCLRLGRGELEWTNGIDYPERHFEVVPDDLTQRMYELAERKYMLKNVPVTLSLTEDFVTGIIGAPKVRLALVKQLLMQMAVMHSYDEVKLIVLTSPKEQEALSFTRYLPHCWDAHDTIRLTASGPADAYRIAEHLKSRMGEKFAQEKDLKKILKTRPYYIVCATDKKLLESMEFIKEVLLEDQNFGLSIIAAFDELPKECSRIIRLSDCGEHTLVSLKGRDSEGPLTFEMDRFDPVAARRSMKVLENTKLRTGSVAEALPKSCAFLDMFGAGRVEHLNARSRWRTSDPIRSLAAPIGVAADGSTFELDMHEKFQGPHGLVAGMTGSGKSQFLISYILAMAVNYHPDEVAFILIDYKGGGLADAFYDEAKGVRLPHLVGTITNLDGNAIQRSLMSIESEIKRRQRIFREANLRIGEGTMDIYTYQKLYRNGKVDKPVPHLFIISDEFAELKNQQPGFMAQLISAARIGRSLGVHLILATQRPAGVVSDEIRSNAKVKVCLRVQDRTDSMDMLKRPEAAELRDTGRFYLQVGYNEFFAMGQSAYSGMPYEPKDTVPIRRDDAVEFLDDTGRIILRNAPVQPHRTTNIKELVAVVKYLSDLAAEENYEVKMLWKEPLPKVMTLDDMEQVPEDPEIGCGAVLGLVDDPENQSQGPLVMDMLKGQNLAIVGESGSGKSMLLQTLLYSLSERYSPEEVNYYIIDLSGKQLSLFTEAPHCGGYLTEEDEGSFDRFFGFISDEVARRKQIFKEAGVGGYEQYLEQEKMPLMLVVIDNMAAFNSTSLASSHTFQLHERIRACSSCGIKFVLTANFPNELNTRIKQEVADRLALRSKDRYVYSDILGPRVTYAPGEMPGRGLCVIEDRPLEFHAALVAHAETSSDQNNLVREKIRQLRERWGDRRAERTFRLSREAEYYRDFCGNFAPGRLPLGYALPSQKPVALPLRQMGYLSVYFGNPAGIVPVMENLLYTYRREKMKIVLVKRKENSIFGSRIPEGEDMTIFTNDPGDNVPMFEYFCKEAAARNQLRDDYCRRNGIALVPPASTEAAYDHIRSNSAGLVVIFESMTEFCQLADDYRSKTIPGCLKALEGKNCYFLGCFYGGDPSLSSFDPIMTAFNPKKQVMLFGGCYAAQNLVTLKREYREISKVSPKYDHCLMHYRDEVYPLYMPCGPLVVDEGREDERSIFA